VSNKISRIFTEPLIQFLVLGSLIYGAYALFGTPEEDFRETTVHVDANRIDAFILAWESRWNRPPTRQEIDGVIQSYIREDVLYRQAVTMGLNEDDPITRRRMAQKLEFLTSDLALVVPPKDGELEAFFEENRQDYREPDRISIRQVFFNPDTRGNSVLTDAAEMLERLQTAGVPGPLSLEAGDQSMLQGDFIMATEAEVARWLGSPFAESVMDLKTGQWHGPVLSGYGTHLVYVFEYQESPPPDFADVETVVFEDWKSERRETFNADFLDSLKKRYDIVIDEIPVDRILETTTESVTEQETVSTS